MKVGDSVQITIKGTFMVEHGDTDPDGNAVSKNEIKLWISDAMFRLLEKTTVTFGPIKSKKATVRKK